MKVSSPKSGDAAFVASLKTFGYLRRATVELYYGILRTLGVVATLSCGAKAVDAEVFSLDLTKKSLLNDYILSSGDKPFILNIGSYT
jgi:hypothetical protein